MPQLPDPEGSYLAQTIALALLIASLIRTAAKRGAPIGHLQSHDILTCVSKVTPTMV